MRVYLFAHMHIHIHIYYVCVHMLYVQPLVVKRFVSNCWSSVVHCLNFDVGPASPLRCHWNTGVRITRQKRVVHHGVPILPFDFIAILCG